MDFSKAKSLYVGNTPVEYAWLNGRRVWPPDPGEAIMQSLVLWYDPARQGCTNENMAANPVLKDLTGNGHDATLYNFAWTEENGINTDEKGLNILFDGVSSYGEVTGLPLLTKDPGYTVFGKILDQRTWGTHLFLTKLKTNGITQGAFTIREGTKHTRTFGTLSSVGFPSTGFFWQTTNSFCEQGIPPGWATDLDFIVIGGGAPPSNNRSLIKFYSLMLFDRDLTDEEIEWVKTNIYDIPPERFGLLLNDNTYVPYEEVISGTSAIVKDDVVGIVFTNLLSSFIMSPENVGPCYFCGAGVLPDPVPNGLPPTNLTSSSVLRAVYKDGEEYTDRLLPSLTGDANWAVPRAKNYVFKNGTSGYLGSAYEYHQMMLHYEQINEMAKKVGFDELFPGDDTHRYFTSVLLEFKEDTRWVWIWSGNDYIDGGSGQGYWYIRPLGAYTPTEQNTGD